MKIQLIPLNDLIVNKANDRHGELANEDSAIEWLLQQKADHMKNLAGDIVESGQIYKPPLVSQNGNGYVVYDGNRRTTALKLLQKPERAPTQKWAEFFSELRRKWPGKFPDSIECQLENDGERLDEILYRRHTGQQSGIGQSQWDAEAKSNFQRRTGKDTKLNVAEEIEKLLHTHGRLRPEEKIPRSNMNRLLSAEQFRNRAGIALEGNKLKLTHGTDAVLSALEKISRDLISKRITLDDIWDNDAKRRYLDSLCRDSVLPTADQALPEAKTLAETTALQTPLARGNLPKSVEPKDRHTLIRNIQYHLEPAHDNRKALDIWKELQYGLILGQHDNAISVLFRVLVELSIDIYIDRNKIQGIKKSENMATKFKTVLSHMLSRQLIEKKYYDQLEKFDDGSSVFSANTLNAYVHSNDFFPSDHHLKNMWDTLEKFVIHCIR